MKQLSQRILLLIGTVVLSAYALAQGCSLPVCVKIDERQAGLTKTSARTLTTQLKRLVSQCGLGAELGYSPFIVTAHVDVIDKDVVAGTPVQIVQKLAVTIFVGDANSRTLFSEETVELRGIGTNETKSSIDAIKHIGNNAKLRAAISAGRERIETYYNTQYQSILLEAKRQASSQNFVKALALCASIPSCSQGAEAAIRLGESIYNRQRDQLNQQVLQSAKAIWAAGQDADAAADAAAIAAEIDPESSAYAGAQVLLKDIQKQQRTDIDFETKEKYRNEQNMKEKELDAWREVGIAIGQGQQPDITTITWLTD